MRYGVLSGKQMKSYPWTCCVEQPTAVYAIEGSHHSAVPVGMLKTWRCKNTSWCGAGSMNTSDLTHNLP